MSGDETQSPGESGPARSWRYHSKWYWIAAAGCFALFLLIAFVASKHINISSFHEWIKAQNAVLVIVLMSVLPLFGFPASVTFFVGGARFGALGGLGVTALTIAVNLIATYWITHSFLRRPIEAVFKRYNRRIPQIPEGDYAAIVMLVALVPGLPYAAKNYLLALGGVPWRPYFWAAWPAHMFHASLGILAGDFTSNLTAANVAFLACYGLVLFGLSRRVVRGLRARSAAAREIASDV